MTSSLPVLTLHGLQSFEHLTQYFLYAFDRETEQIVTKLRARPTRNTRAFLLIILGGEMVFILQQRYRSARPDDSTD